MPPGAGGALVGARLLLGLLGINMTKTRSVSRGLPDNLVLARVGPPRTLPGDASFFVLKQRDSLPGHVRTGGRSLSRQAASRRLPRTAFANFLPLT